FAVLPRTSIRALSPRLILAGLFAALGGAVVLTGPTAAQEGSVKKRPLTHKDYDIWNTLQSPMLSPDGKVVTYSILPPEGDGTLYVKNLGTGSEFAINRAGRPAGPAVVGPGGEPAEPGIPPIAPIGPGGVLPAP